MPSSHLILCRPLLLLPPIPPSIRVFSSESTLRMRWPKYWSFSFSIIPSKEIPGLNFLYIFYFFSETFFFFPFVSNMLIFAHWSIFIMGVLKPLLYNSNMCPIDVGFCCLFSIKLKLSCFLVYLMIFYCILDIIIIMLWDCFIVKFFVSTGSSVTALVRKGGYHLGTAQLGWKFRFPT